MAQSIQLRSDAGKFATATALSFLFVFPLFQMHRCGYALRAADTLNVDSGTLVQVSAVQFCGYLLAAIIYGILADYIGGKAVLSVACILLLAGTLVHGSSQRI